MMSQTHLPPHWKIVKVSEIARKFISGGTPSTKERTYWDGTIPWTTSAPISEDEVFLSRAQRFITQGGLKNSASNIVPQNNLLVGTRVGVGKAVVNLVDIAISQDITGVVLDSSSADSTFVAYQFKSGRIKDFFDGRKRGTTIKGVSRSDLMSLNLFIPDISEQRAIAQALRTVQEAKEARQRELTLERERKAALMDYLFTHGTRGEPRKQTEIGKMPESWKETKLGALIDIKHGYAFKSKYFTESGDIVLTPGNFMIEGGLYWGVKTKFTSEKYSVDYLFEEGDLVVVMTDLTPSAKLLGAPAFIPEGKRILHNQRIGKILLENNFTNKSFLYVLFNSIAFRNHMVATSTGSTVRHTSPNRIKDYRFGLPSIMEQQEITYALNACDTKSEAIEREIDILDELFQAMLEELMTGRVSAIPLT